MSTKVSTVIPAYNAERTIADAIDSALAQQYEGHEIIVVDDGSTDATSDILARYEDAIRVITQKNGGLSVARNAGIRQSKGKYLAFLDSDDIWLPGKLARLTAMLDANPRASLAFSEYGYIDQRGTEYRQSAIGDEPMMLELMAKRPFPLFTFKEPILPSSWVIPRKALECSGGFCEAFKGSGGFDDYWMLLLLADLGEFIHVRDKLMLYRAFAGNLADKYGAGAAVFKGLVKKHYGRRLSRDLIRGLTECMCSWLMMKAAHQMNGGDRYGAIGSLLRVAQWRPGYFLDAQFTSRILQPQNRKRVGQLVSFRSQRAR